MKTLIYPFIFITIISIIGSIVYAIIVSFIIPNLLFLISIFAVLYLAYTGYKEDQKIN